MKNSKKCIKCKQLKNLDEFHNSKRSKDGHHYDCKSCIAIANKKLYDKYMGKAREYHQLTKKKINKQCNVCNKVKFVESFVLCGQTKGKPHYRFECKKCMNSNPHLIKRKREYKANKHNKDRANMLARKRRDKVKDGDGFRYTKGERYSFFQYNKYLNQFLKRHGERKCGKCHLIKPFNEYTENTENHHRLREVGRYCRKCTTVVNTIYKKSSPEIMKKCNKTSGIKANKGTDDMSDNYIKSLIIQSYHSKSILKQEDIPDELVEAKRQYIQIKRVLGRTQLGKIERKYNDSKVQKDSKSR